MREVEIRIQRIERSARRWKLATAVSLAIATGRIFLGAAPDQPVPERTVTRELDVVAEDGSVLGYFGTRSGAAFLTLGNAETKERAVIVGGYAKSGPMFALANKDEKTIFQANSGFDGSGEVSVASARGKTGASMVASFEEEGGAVSAFDKDEDLRARLWGTDVDSFLLLATHKGKATIDLSASDVRGSRIEVKQPGQFLVSHLP